MLAFAILSVTLLINWPEPAGEGAPEDDESGWFISGEETGRWRPFRDPRNSESDIDQAEKIKQLEKIGYLGGNVTAGGDTGVMVNHEDAWPGLNFYTSGHAPEAVLMDMDGNELHRWRCEFESLVSRFSEAGLSSDSLSRPDEDKEFWRRAALLPNGDVYAIFEGSAIVKLNRDSEVQWTLANRAHHDLEIMPDGSLYLLTRKALIDPQINKRIPVLKDYVERLSADGEPMEEYSLWEALNESAHSMHLVVAPRRGDVFHTNALEVLDGSHEDQSPFFKAGNILLSFLRLSTLAILDPDTGKIVWTLRGMWWGQHQPTLLENGNMLVFDNWGGVIDRERYSRVIEFNPLTQEILWSYDGSPDVPFYSRTCGSNQRLPNGNTLITETDNGRVFEVNPEKQILWEFINPYRGGPNDDLIASVFELIRFEPETLTFLADESTTGSL